VVPSVAEKPPSGEESRIPGPNAILGAAVFAVIENGVGLWLVADLNFPAQLVRVSFVFAFLLLSLKEP
jgi:hypothetical protein